MSVKNEGDIFAEQIALVHERADTLYQSAKNFPARQPQLLLECLENLQVALEELHVAEAELQSQNEQLAIAHEDLQAERRRYQELFEFAPDAYLITDLQGTVQEANQAAGELFQITPYRLMGKPLVSFVQEEQRRPFRTTLNQLPTIDRVQEWELNLLGRNQTHFEAAVTVKTARNGSGDAIALRWLIRDITARKRAEEQMRQLQLQNLQLIEADRLKTQFMATMSHELRTPMNAILGFSDLLLRRFHDQYDAQQINIIERIFNNGRHLLSLIEEILDFSKLKAHRLDLRLEAFDLAELATCVIEEIASLAEQKNLELRLELAEPSVLVVNDRLRLRQILINLLSNAIKFTEQGSVCLEISLAADDQVAIVVKDTGIGIEPTEQANIFKEFRQLNQTITRRHSGTGLGLSITDALVQLMQGSIVVDSRVGFGSTFRVNLPRWVVAS